MLSDFNKKGNKDHSNDKLLFQAIGIAFLVIVVLLFFVDLKIYQKKQKLKSQIYTYQNKILDLEKSNQTLKNEIANADNKDYLEKIAYEQLGQAKPGETVYSFVTSDEKPKENQQQKSFWELWLGQISNSFNWIKSKF